MQSFSRWTAKNESTLYEELESCASGLTTDQAKKRLLTYGLNQITFEQFSIFQIFIRQIKSPFIYLLIVASLIAFCMSNAQEGILILLFVMINTLLGFFQEYQAGKTIQLLKKYLVHHVTVIRNNKEEKVNVEFIVPGDIIIIKAGDMLPADIRFLQITNLAIDESTLTGESMPVKKDCTVLTQKIETVFDATNMGFSGTTIINGKGIGIVCQTGQRTVVGTIAHLAFNESKQGYFIQEIDKFSRFIIKIIFITIISIFILNIALKGIHVISIGQLFIFTLALLITITPEALPLVITFSLARGARRLAKNKVIVKRLSAIEDLGSIDVLCSDKTGTLTENRLEVEEIYADDTNKALVYGILALGSDQKHTNSFNKALWDKLTNDQKKEFEQFKLINEIPFDPSRLRTTTIVSRNDQQLLLVMGAFEYIIEHCNPNQAINFYQKISADNGNKGKRIIALAVKKLDSEPELSEDTLKNEKDLELIGLFSFIDPIKKDAAKAIHQAKKLGIKIFILTGDTPEVAGYVAHQIGLIPTADKVMSGSSWQNLNENEQQKSLKEFNVFARVNPEQKLQIIQKLQKEHYVGYLGEGINDAPALKIANVALVVQGASDIAREAADIILLKKSLLLVVNGIYEGRIVFTNTIKYIKTSMSSIFGNFYSVAISSLFVDYLPMLPVQILLTNLLSDFPLIAISTDSVDYKDLKRPKFYNPKEFIQISLILSGISSIFDFIIFGIFYKDAQKLRTVWFIESVLSAVVLIYSVRTNKLFFKAVAPSIYLASLSLITALITLLLPYTNLGQRYFDFIPLSPYVLTANIIIVVCYFLVTELIKDIYYRFYTR